MKKSYFYLFLILLMFLVSCKNGENYQDNSVDIYANWEAAKSIYLESINKSIAYLDSLKEISVSDKKAKTYFIKARQEFKKAEPFASYLYPEVGHRTNGPALPIFTDDTQRVLSPTGLQKMEESIYEGEVSDATFKSELESTRGLMDVLRKGIDKHDLDPQRFVIATHQQLLRVISHSISGFDTPVSHLGLNEAGISLQNLLDVYDASIAEVIKKNNADLDKSFRENIAKSTDFIAKNTDFDSFDRYTFIRDYVNPVTRDWVAIRKASNLWEGVNNKPFNFDAPTFFEEDSFNVAFFTPAINRNPTEKQIALGEKLFFDPNLAKNGKMACATCHIPEQAYANDLALNLDNLGKPLQRNTPTLINSVYQQAFFWDGRSGTILDQISSVFTNKQEFNTSVHEFSDAILQDTTYVKLFDEAYGGISTKNTNVIKAISSYISTLSAFNSKFDRNIRGEEDTFTPQEKEGFNLFMGRALCATCHFMPLTNGTVPPFFLDSEKEVIGVPKTAQNKELDDDLGFYWKYEKELQRGMFKTPTVRNAAVTAPYMHNGIYSSLEEVIDFYNSGGGGGLGFDLEFQTLPFDELNLTNEEKAALVAYIKTLTDTDIKHYKVRI